MTKYSVFGEMLWLNPDDVRAWAGIVEMHTQNGARLCAAVNMHRGWGCDDSVADKHVCVRDKNGGRVRVSASDMCKRVLYAGTCNFHEEMCARDLLDTISADTNPGWILAEHKVLYNDRRKPSTERIFGTLMMGLQKLREVGPGGEALVLDPVLGWHESLWEDTLEDGGWKYEDCVRLVIPTRRSRSRVR